MRTAAAATLVILSIGCGSSDSLAQQPAGDAAAAAAVEARSRAWILAAIHFDEQRFRSFPMPGFAVLWVEPAAGGRPARWVAKSAEDWIASLRSGKQRYYAVELRDTEVIVTGEVATLRYAYTERGARDGVDYTDNGMLVETWVKRDGQWFAVSFVAL